MKQDYSSPNQVETRLLNHLCFSEMKESCSRSNQVETRLLIINCAFPRWNKVAEVQIRWKQGCSTSIMLFQVKTRLPESKSGWNTVAQQQAEKLKSCIIYLILSTISLESHFKFIFSRLISFIVLGHSSVDRLNRLHIFLVLKYLPFYGLD